MQQLLSVVDDLNYRFGIMHQDVAARNLLIDEKENLCIVHFNYSIMIKEHYTPERDDSKGVIFTLYEIITLDEHYREVPHAQQDAEASLRRDWVKHPDVKLDSDVQLFRQVLDAWIAQRKQREFKLVDTCIYWPWMPKEPPARVPVLGPGRGTEMTSVPVLFRSDMIQMNGPYLNWERPASYRLRDVLDMKD
jgi:hypothetical protein